MRCSDFEQLIALYVEEDLSAVERGRVEGHLKGCSDCWDLAEDLRESQAVFKSIRQDIPNATALSALRERVLSEVTGLESRPWFERVFFGGLRRRAALAGIALVVIGSGGLWLARSPRVIPQTPLVAAVDTPPPVDVPSASEPQSAPVQPAAAPKPAPAPAHTVQEPKQVAIKFVTDDPNIIIYWLVDEQGD